MSSVAMNNSQDKIKELRKMRALFSRYDEGIRVNDVMRYSVTKETIAHKIAKDAYDRGFETVVDGCGGCGGNSIQFAQVGMYVALVELNAYTLSDAEHNAGIYGVAEWIKFFNSDILKFDCQKSAAFDPDKTLFFSSPEWGGPEYKQAEVFDLERLNPRLSELLGYAQKQGYKEMCVYAPRTSNLAQADSMGCYKCEYMFTNRWCNAVCLWFKTSESARTETRSRKRHRQLGMWNK